MHPYYQKCCSCIGKCVSIRTRDGRSVYGQVNRVSPQYVYLSPIGQSIKNQSFSANYRIKKAIGSEDKNVRGQKVFIFNPYIVPLAAIVGLTIVGTAPFWGGGFYGPYGGFGKGFY